MGLLMQGNPADGLDFYQARWHDSLAAKGSDNDLYVRNGGVQLENKLYDPIMKCSGGPSAFVHRGWRLEKQVHPSRFFGRDVFSREITSCVSGR